MRIDHAFGLARLWLVPSGQPSSEGAYLAFPFTDLLRLAALESHRARAVIVAEDLGTAPEGFTAAITARGMLGMRVLWFERDHGGAFRAPDRYDRSSIAMTGTHDTPTVAGWWRGIDIGWSKALGRLPTPELQSGAEHSRAADRRALWQAIGDGGDPPVSDDPAPVVARALLHIGRAASQLAIVPLEDLLALDQQPNLPGTIDEHPNWRRRLSAPLGDLLAQPDTSARIDALDEARRS